MIKAEAVEETTILDAMPAVDGMAATLKYGENDLDLGLNPQLQAFKQFGGRGYSGFESSADDFGGEIRDAMRQAETIRFNLDGVDLSKISSKSGILSAETGQPIYGYTDYEIYTIINNTSYLNKTMFYLNGQVVPTETVLDQMINLRR